MAGTRATLASAAARMLSTGSAAEATLAEVVARSGAARGSLYHYYPGGKDEMVLAAVDAEGLAVLAALRDSSPATPHAVAAAFVETFRQMLGPKGDSGCALATVVVDAVAGPATSRAAHHLAQWQDELARGFEQAGVERTRAAEASALLHSVCQGALIVSRAERDVDVFDAVTRLGLATLAVFR